MIRKKLMLEILKLVEGWLDTAVDVYDPEDNEDIDQFLRTDKYGYDIIQWDEDWVDFIFSDMGVDITSLIDIDRDDLTEEEEVYLHNSVENIVIELVENFGELNNENINN